MSKIHAAWHVLNIQFYLLFTFISFREDLVKYLHCARAYRTKAPQPLPMRYTPLLNVNWNFSQVLITLILNDGLWAPQKGFLFIPRDFKGWCTHLWREKKKQVLYFCVVVVCVGGGCCLCIRWSLARIDCFWEKSLFHSVECKWIYYWFCLVNHHFVTGLLMAST